MVPGKGGVAVERLSADDRKKTESESRDSENAKHFNWPQMRIVFIPPFLGHVCTQRQGGMTSL